MPWRVTSPMYQRQRFVLDAEHTLAKVRTVARRGRGVKDPTKRSVSLQYAMTRLIGATPQSVESICSCTTPQPAARRGSEGRLSRQLERFLSL
jgi:hypothetical protein